MKNMDICFGVDSNYVPYMGACMASILVNEEEYCAVGGSIIFHIINNGITEDDKTKIESLRSIRDFEIKYYMPNVAKYEKWFEKMENNHHFSPAMMYRLDIPYLLKDLDKVLYIDCDIIVRGSIKILFEEDIDNYYAFVFDMEEKFKNYHGQYKEIIERKGLYLRIRKRIGLDDRHTYFCSGLMMLNNKLLREVDIEKTFEEYVYQKDHFIYGDQDILQYSFPKDKLKFLPEKHHFCAYAYYHRRYTLPDINDIVVIHYLTVSKPWNDMDNVCLFVEEFWKYFAMTPWFRDDITKWINIMVKQEISRNGYMVNKFNELEVCRNDIINSKLEISNKLDRLIDKIAWFIPLRKWRKKFRDGLK